MLTQSDKSKINRSLDDFKGMTLMLDRSKGLEVHVDESFASEWDSLNSPEDTLVLSRTVFVIKHMGCPLHCESKLQTKISLSTTEAEHIFLSHSMRENLPLMVLLKEIHGSLKIEEVKSGREVKCKVFEDNNRCIKMDKYTKIHPVRITSELNSIPSTVK